MNKAQQSLEISYANIDWARADTVKTSHWDPGFDAERCLVFLKLGPFQRLFEKPSNFTKRFYHTLYPLPIEHWQFTEQLALYDGFCSIDVDLTIRYQGTLNYIKKSDANLQEVNKFIKTCYEPLVQDIVQETLLKLTDGAWVSTGLTAQEHEIEIAVTELLLGQEIQADALCQLKPHFGAYPDIKFKEESIYLMAMKKNYELISQKQQQTFLQEHLLEQQRLEQKQQQLELLAREHEIKLQSLALKAEHEQKTLLEHERQLSEKLAIEKRLHAEQVKHETALHQLSITEALIRQEQKEALERQFELKTLDTKLEHQLIIKERQLAAKIKAFELEKAQWSKAKAKIQAEEIETRNRLKQQELNADLVKNLSIISKASSTTQSDPKPG